jgi:hypothetical protein
VSIPPAEPPPYGPPPPAFYPPPLGYYPAPPAKTNVWAILSLLFGLVGLIGVPVSVICGIIGLKKAQEGQGGRGLAIAGLVISGVWVLLVVGMVAFVLLSSMFGDERGPASYFNAGDCITDMPPGAREVEIVDCKDLHRGEVVAVLMLPDGDFPGQAVIKEHVNKCDEELAAYAPSAVGDPSVGLKKRYPDEESWGMGDRSVTCIAAFESPRTGSIKG